ncbi:MAG: hypothetical protein ABSG65_20270 [Bryobacteraceae bacterium]|jgi:hypothetical protein
MVIVVRIHAGEPHSQEIDDKELLAAFAKQAVWNVHVFKRFRFESTLGEEHSALAVEPAKHVKLRLQVPLCPTREPF